MGGTAGLGGHLGQSRECWWREGMVGGQVERNEDEGEVLTISPLPLVPT